MSIKSRELDEFVFPEDEVLLGCGALGRVIQCIEVSSQRRCACKILSKMQLLQMNKVHSVMSEKRALKDLSPHPHIVQCIGTAQSADELYFFLEELTRGDLHEHVKRISQLRGPVDVNGWLPGRFCISSHDLRLIGAQLVKALEHVHSGFHKSRFTLKDFKSENVCFAEDGRCVLIDFDCIDECVGLLPETNFGDPIGTKKLSSSSTSGQRRKTVSEIQEARKMSTMNFCGTAQFVSPELLGQLKWSFASDLWALGIILYHCLFGRHPFSGDTTFDTMKAIVDGLQPIHFPPYPGASVLYTLSEYQDIRDLIVRLLHLDPIRRLGVGKDLHPNYQSVRDHDFFSRGHTWAMPCFDSNNFLSEFNERPERPSNIPSLDPSGVPFQDGPDQISPNFRVLDPSQVLSIYEIYCQDIQSFENISEETRNRELVFARGQVHIIQVALQSIAEKERIQSLYQIQLEKEKEEESVRLRRREQGHKTELGVNNPHGLTTFVYDVNEEIKKIEELESSDCDVIIDDVGINKGGHILTPHSDFSH